MRCLSDWEQVLPECVMITPDNRKISILGQSLKIPVQVVIEPEREVIGKNTFELYDSSSVKLRFNGSSKAEIRYTLNGDQPGMSSTLYKDSIWISKTSVLTATAFENGKAVAAPAAMFFNKVIRPQEGSLGRIDFGIPDTAQEATYSLWLGNHVKRVPFNKDSVLNMPKIEASLLYVDINVARGGGPKPGFKLQQIKLRKMPLRWRYGLGLLNKLERSLARMVFLHLANPIERFPVL